MEAVMLLLVLLAFSCALSVWTAAAGFSDRKRLSAMESTITNQGNVISSLVAALGGDGAPTSAVPVIGASSGSALADAASVLDNASEQDLAAAAEILKKLGLGD